MRRTRITIDAAVLAAAIGIQRLIERQVRRIVTLDHALRLFHRHCCLEWRQRVACHTPAIIDTLTHYTLETPLDLQRCTTAFCYFMFHLIFACPQFCEWRLSRYLFQTERLF